MKKRFVISLVGTALVAALTLALSCQRAEIEYPTSDYYLAVAFADGSTAASHQTTFAAGFYDTETGKLAYSTLLRSESHPMGLPAGGYVTGLVPGDYDMVVYNFDTQRTSVHDAENWNRIYADAVMITRQNDVPVTFNPDHLWVYGERIHVPFITAGDGVFVIETSLASIVEEWTVTVDGIRNLDIAEGISFFISGQSRGQYLGAGDILKERAIVSFDGSVEKEVLSEPDEENPVEADGEGLVARGRYRTFGALASADRVLLTVEVKGPNGSVYYGQADVTEQVFDRANADRAIRATVDIEVAPRTDGGFTPEAKPWNPDLTTIVLE